MKILLCNPKNTQGTKHSRKGMYVPLGILSIATCLKKRFGDEVEITVVDEDVDDHFPQELGDYNLVGLYSTTFNYKQAARYAYFAKEQGCTTVLGGPHPSILYDNILRHKSCFDYVLRFETEFSFVALVEHLMEKSLANLLDIPGLAFKDADGKIHASKTIPELNLADLPIISRDFVRFDRYVENYRSVYSDSEDVVPGSVYSSKGCSWRDKTGGCVFCARLEEGVRFRPIPQIWEEIALLKDRYGVNTIWDIADDNLNNKEWFIEFVESRPDSCRDMRFFIYSRVNCIKPWVIDYFHKLGVDEVFLGVESGDNRLLKGSFKGQTRESALRALRILQDGGVRFYPSFVLGLPGENVESMENTLSMCREIREMGGLSRMSATILKPIPGSAAYDMVLEKTRFGKDLAISDDVDLVFLEKYWIESMTGTTYYAVEEYRDKINVLMGGLQVFGSSSKESS
ncbi:Radical SAM domain protein [Desulfatibacillum aliphaticivorans]|uniref:Radical SAM domain protein n=1 Tax=Desulfatibacillum aliphaticivorans TaxID=218208 RepID=B8FAS2_DESAL|nr:radical SAM protein [Desulfatibacillum aliphaticivorans]ACL03368.1 Radical SAM domain protein [Desulfatibacillum aliphaticivorans]